MNVYWIEPDSVDVSVVLRAVDSADGTPETAFDHAAAGIDLKYRREGATNVDITEAALAALTTAHTDGGVEQIGNGYFRLDLPDAAVAAGTDGVLVHGVATGMVIMGCYIHLRRMPTDVRQWLGTAVASPTVAGVPEVDVTHLDGVAQSLVDLKDFADAGYDPATNKVQGVVLADTVTTLVGHTPQTGDNFARLGAPAGASVSADILATFVRIGAPAGASVSADIAAVKADTAAIKTKTDNLPVDPADQSLIIAATDAIMGRLGAPVGASVSADVAAVQSDTNDIQTRLPAALVGGRMDANVGEMTAGVITDATITTAAALEIVDEFLDRNLAVGADSGTETNRTVRQAFRMLRNKVDVPLGIVYKEDDATASWSFTKTTDAAAVPITVIDPASA